LPALAMSLLPIFIEPALAVAILTMPIILTNGQQMISIQGWTIIVRQFTLAGVTIFVTITIVSSFVSDIPSHFIGIVIGISLILFPLFSFMKLQLPVTLSPKWQILAGVLAGITGGLSAEKTPLIIYCAALNLPRKTFMVAVGFIFFTGGLGMLVGLSYTHLMNATTAPASAIAVVMALVGFQVGAYLRRGINGVMFRRLLLSTMFILGLRQIIVNLF
jgi:uncharacterized protein